MTTYFDMAHGRIRGLLDMYVDDIEHTDVGIELDAIESDVVRDVTICAEWPGMPADLRDAIHRTVLRYASNEQPRGAHNSDAPDYADNRARAIGLTEMVNHLHSVFHGVSRLPGFTDSPRSPIGGLDDDGDDRRARMCLPDLDYWRRRLEDLDEDERKIAAVRVGRWAFEHAYRAHRDFDAAQRARREAIAAVTKA